MKFVWIRRACLCLFLSIITGIAFSEYAGAQSLEFLGSYESFDSAFRVSISGDHAYIIQHVWYGNSLVVIDVSDPSNPVYAAGLDAGTYPQDIDVKGDYAYICVPNYGQLNIIDISNPANPALLDSLECHGGPWSLAVQGNLLYVGESHAFEIFDLSEPASPVSLSYITEDVYYAFDVFASGNYAYFVSNSVSSYECEYAPELCGLRIADVADPTAPFLVGSLNFELPMALVTRANYTFVVDWYVDYFCNISAVDVSDRSQPFTIAVYDLGGYSESISVFGPYLLVPSATGDNGVVEVINVADPAEPAHVTSHQTYGWPRAIAVSGEYVYVANVHSLVIFRFVTPPCENSYIAGDCNNNGVPLELGDVIAMVGMYRATSLPYYICDCQEHGYSFAPNADPNGNCVAFELGDVVTEMTAYRGTGTVSSCPDCPAQGGLPVPDNNKSDKPEE